ASDTNSGAISNVGSTMIVSNSTFSANTARNYGGGIYSIAPITVTNSTLSGNSAVAGGGFYSTNSSTRLSNTIIANSVSGGDCVSSAFALNSHHLIADGGFTPHLAADPMLDGRANNGGSTQRVAPLAGSAAVDMGDDSVCSAAPVSNL